MTVPNAWPGNLGSTADWGNETTAQAHAGRWPTRVAGLWAGLARSTPWRMCALHQAVYDGWVTAEAPGWRVADLLPFFRRSERLRSAQTASLPKSDSGCRPERS